MLEAAVIAVLAFAPVAAVAQEPLPIPAPPLARGLAADRGANALGEIVEAGRSTIAVPADRIKLTFRAYPGPSAPAAPQATSQSITDTENLVVTALRANGIADAHVVTAVLGNVNTPDVIVGALAKPTHDSIETTEKRVLAALPSTVLASLRNVNVDGQLEADACAPIVARARAAAFDDARKRAESLASVAGVRLGALANATEADQTNGCTDFGPTTPSFNGNGFSPMDGMLYVSVSVNAGFAIRP